MKADQIGKVQLRMKMLGHELFIARADGTGKKFGLMNRKQAEATVEPIKQRFWRALRDIEDTGVSVLGALRAVLAVAGKVVRCGRYVGLRLIYAIARQVGLSARH